ncbi:MAG: 4-hydroxy-tetrahydrodipicolinate synthase [Firmicutes bacterium]|nr:4-hydroxy-tetrahydrodipicolinate synthase [Bacillota bacterium]
MIFKGSSVALITPFCKHGNIHYGDTENLINFHVNEGTNALVILGTTGEASTITPKERCEYIKFVVRQTNARLPVIVGVGTNCTTTTIKYAQNAEANGASAIMVVTPYYNKPTQQGLINHYTHVAKSVSLPIMLYTVPARTGGVSIEPDTLVELIKANPNIVALKDASADFELLAKYKYALQKMYTGSNSRGNSGNSTHDFAPDFAHESFAPENFAFYSGDDATTIPFLSLGTHGVVSVMANIIPNTTQTMVNLYLSGNTKEAARIQIKLMPFIRGMFLQSNPIPVKTAAKMVGLISENILRAPLSDMCPQQANELKAILSNYGLG